MSTTAHRPSTTSATQPPVSGMPIELWRWLREAMVVRPHVVERVRAALAKGEQVSADDVALAILESY